MKQLGILDSAFINLEHKNVPQHIGSFGIYDQSTAPGGQVRFKSVINHFEHQIKKIPLFRTRLIQAPGRFARPYWIVDDNFDVEFHLRHIALPHPGDWRQLCILIARLHSRPIDMSRPLWESYVIEGLDNIEGLPEGCFAIYTKIHHSIVDGGGADGFMAAIHDLEPIVHPDIEEGEKFEAEDLPTPYEMVSQSTRSYMNNVWSLTKGGFELSKDVGKSAVKLAKGELKTPPVVDSPKTRFNKSVGPYRVIEACDFSLDDFKMIKDKTKTKINDVALAVVSGAMRKYLDEHDEHPETSLVATLPINMRTRVGDTGEANQVGSIFTSLNSDIDDPLERIIAIHQSTDEAKEFGENAPLKDALKLAGAMSPRITKRLINTYVDNKLTEHLPMKVNTVVSNVPGPNFPLYCSGAKLIQYHGLGVLTPGVGLFNLVFSYCGRISITMLSDREIMPDPQNYRKSMEAAFAELKERVEACTPDEVNELTIKHLPAAKRAETLMEQAQEKLDEAERLLAQSEAAGAETKPETEAKKKKVAAKKSVLEEKTEEAKPQAKAKAKAKPKRKRAASSSSSSKKASSASAKTKAVKAKEEIKEPVAKPEDVSLDISFDTTPKPKKKRAAKRSASASSKA